MTEARIAEAAEKVCRELGLGDDAEWRIARSLAVVAFENNLPGMTPTESRILHVLRKLNGRSVTFDSLIDLADVGGGRETLKVFISRLRRKLSGERIETIWGYGYRWVCSSDPAQAAETGSSV